MHCLFVIAAWLGQLVKAHLYNIQNYLNWLRLSMRFMGIKFDALHAEVSKATESTKFSPLNLKLHGHEICKLSRMAGKY